MMPTTKTMSNIHTEEYKNYTIKIEYDELAESPTEWGNGEVFACDERDLYINPKQAPKNITIGEVLDLNKTHNLYTGNFGSHSGTWLCTYNTLDIKKIHILAVKDCKDEGNEDYKGEALTRKLADYIKDDIFVALPKEDKETKKNKDQFIKSFWSTMDYYIRGNVYIYFIEDETGESVDACGGFYGYYDEKGGALQGAKEVIDGYTKEDRAKRLNDKAESLFLEAQTLSERAKELVN